MKRIKSMMSKIPILESEQSSQSIDEELLRAAIISELDAINLYQKMAETTSNQLLKTMFLDIAKEEKTHAGEFQTLLLDLDNEQVEELEKGKQEVEEKK
jgi:rubrerythrin